MIYIEVLETPFLCSLLCDVTLCNVSTWEKVSKGRYLHVKKYTGEIKISYPLVVAAPLWHLPFMEHGNEALRGLIKYKSSKGGATIERRPL